MSRIASSLVSALVALDAASPDPLHRQIYLKFRHAILAGRISPGAQIPSSRDLARELGVARNTVLNAVEQLIAEGYLQGEQGSGTYVNRTLPDDTLRVPHLQAAIAQRVRKHAPLSLRSRGLTAISALLPSAGRAKPFQPAVPAVDAFPFSLWAKLVQKQWRRHPSDLLGLGEPAGHLSLRRAIASYLTGTRAVRCEAEQVIIVSGAQQALDLTSRLLIDPGDPVWIEEPGYPGVRATLLAAGAHLIPVPVDEEGIKVRAGVARAANARLVYATPSHQFPLGYTMTLARRLELLNWSQRVRAWILEDDYDSEYRYTSRPIPALQGLAAQEQVIYVGTFSKVLFPSLRLGYLVVPSALVDVFAAARTVSAGPPPLIEQAVLTEFITEGHFGRHLRRMRALYQERRAVLLDEAKRELTGLLEVQVSDAGLHAIGWLPQGRDDHSAARLAAAAGVDTIPLSSFYQGPNKRSGLMLGFAAFNASELRSGARKLARVLRTVK